MTKTIFWDLDGTLLDSAAVHQNSMLVACRSAGLPLQTTAGPPAGLDGPATFHWLSGLDALLHPQAYNNWYQATICYVLEHLSECQPVEWACRWVVQLAAAGHSQWLVTNSDMLLARAALQHLACSHYFSGIVSRDQVQQGKPAAEPYLLALSRSRCPPRQALAIEDSLSGVQAAKAAGLQVLTVSPLPGQLADFTLPHGMTATQELHMVQLLFGSSLRHNFMGNPETITRGAAIN